MITEYELRVKQAKFEPERQANQTHYRELEKTRLKFVSEFPSKRIPYLSLDDYVEGKENKGSFCYWVEWKTAELGKIQGSSSLKFGVYYDKKAQRYEVISKFEDENAAIKFLREQIARLLEAGRTNNLEEIRKIEISPMFKGKILYLYYPEKYLNIFSEDHLDHFLREIGLLGLNDNLDVLAKRELLHNFKSNDEIMFAWSTHEFMRFLYDAWRPLPKSSKVPEALRKYVDAERQVLASGRVRQENSVIDDIPYAPIGSQAPTRIQTVGSRFQRDEKVRQFVIEQAKGACEYCRELGFPLPNGSHYLEAHHIIALAEQGPDMVDNVIALCPSDHREAHYGAKSVAMENEMVEIIKNRKISHQSVSR